MRNFQLQNSADTLSWMAHSPRTEIRHPFNITASNPLNFHRKALGRLSCCSWRLMLLFIVVRMPIKLRCGTEQNGQTPEGQCYYIENKKNANADKLGYSCTSVIAFRRSTIQKRSRRNWRLVHSVVGCVPRLSSRWWHRNIRLPHQVIGFHFDTWHVDGEQPGNRRRGLRKLIVGAAFRNGFISYIKVVTPIYRPMSHQS
jgi:hypothetical protein